MYYILLEDKYKGKQEDIGCIMSKFSKELYETAGLSLGIYLGPTHQEIESYVKQQNFEIVLEEILWMNMNQEEKINKFSDYLINIESEQNELIVIDSYFFPPNYNEDYLEMILKIVEKSKARIVKVITSNRRNRSLESIFIGRIRGLGMNLDIKYSEKFHDRFWITDQYKGFITGTSLNGVGRKISSINYLEREDIEALFEEIINLVQ
ncbi:hypothetical protein [Paenibacillus senegalimassiliensis]|uniref:hypothetical protein n=1 Tax=Paenibacillus senegalimassiliensis TaxID=1737426 RepID=UPI00073F09C8|nr:hypothetical protein [Paenibacillus senegalimassiliensis]